MHFDDRLATVLRHRATGERAARTQFRQLLDLLGSRSAAMESKLMASAWLRLGALGEQIPAADRAQMIRDPGMRFRNAELAAHLAEDEPQVAAAALARADLTDSQWQILIPRLPIRARGFLRLRRDMPQGASLLLEKLGIHDRGLPLPDSDAEYLVETPGPLTSAPQETESRQAPIHTETVRPDNIRPVPVAANDAAPTADVRVTAIADLELTETEDSEIGALVKRIEAFRQARIGTPPTAQSPRLPLNDRQTDHNQPKLAGFAFTCDSEGRIDWAEPSVAPMVVGKRLTDDDAIPAAVMVRHQPLVAQNVALEGAPLITGNWVVDAAPRFTRPDGRFYGYAGKFRRPAATSGSAAARKADSEADRIRQLLHELRTPVNAIQGFSEIIQQQLFGPTPHAYRALAATIAGDSARILAGFDELDRLARLESGAIELDDGASDLRAMVENTALQLQYVMRPRDATFAASLGADVCIVALAQGECEALGWRLIATLASAIGVGETVRLDLTQDDAKAQLRCELPAALAALDDLFAASARSANGALSAGMFGTGFALRLARAEARAAGGDLKPENGWLVLSLPLLTSADANPSESDVSGPRDRPAGA